MTAKPSQWQDSILQCCSSNHYSKRFELSISQVTWLKELRPEEEQQIINSDSFCWCLNNYFLCLIWKLLYHWLKQCNKFFLKSVSQNQLLKKLFCTVHVICTREKAEWVTQNLWQKLAWAYAQPWRRERINEKFPTTSFWQHAVVVDLCQQHIFHMVTTPALQNSTQRKVCWVSNQYQRSNSKDVMVHSGPMRFFVYYGIYVDH